jgi:23S rRNA pseudouridine2605 synthase
MNKTRTPSSKPRKPSPQRTDAGSPGRKRAAAKATDTRNPAGERLQKVLANAGLGSRREIEGWIEAGRVSVDGHPARLGERVRQDARIEVDGRPVGAARLAAPAHRVIVYNKPEGELVSRADPEGRPTVFQNLPRLRHGRWISVGRLDLNSSGLLLLTTDGELANRLMHPSQSVEREYAVRVLGRVEDAMLERLTHGVELDDGPARFEEIVDTGGAGANHWYHVVIVEGRQREVRRMWELVGVRVSRLIRVRYGNILLGNRTRQGQWRELEAEQSADLYRLAGLEPPSQSKTKRPVGVAKRRQGGSERAPEVSRQAGSGRSHSPWPAGGAFKRRGR